MSYKTGRGNGDFFWSRFHALVKMVFDYQWVTECGVAASRRGGGKWHVKLRKISFRSKSLKRGDSEGLGRRRRGG